MVCHGGRSVDQGRPPRRARRSGLRRREYDEDDVRIRPGRSSRPRTRRQPSHDDAVEAMVIAVDRGRYTCDLDGRTIVAVRARALGRRGVVVGDQVRLVGDVSGRTDALARIVRIAERSSVLTRTADDDESAVEGRQERVVVANAGQLVIVSSLVDPPPRTGFIDRCLVAAYDAEIDPLLCLTKADLASAGPVLDYYAELDLPHVLCQPDEPLTALRAALADRVSVLIGHSGVGKSTLVNRLIPDADRAVGAVSAIGKGRHTSTSVVAMPLPSGHGWIIDTPGIRSFGLAHVSADSLLHGFPDLVESSTTCPPSCDHAGGSWPADGDASSGEPGAGRVATTCGLD
ncbi:MAG: ribosome small subunit-dependent GTPase A, partial [Dactylosporangium sp.]|nr:ribosome small subunit-dependent GTPase A [Dactylosporangium sp.]NNJ62743.1 ribosome small subunit-dependent GTPase A [Dactylosporangium sp.]